MKRSIDEKDAMAPNEKGKTEGEGALRKETVLYFSVRLFIFVDRLDIF